MAPKRKPVYSVDYAVTVTLPSRARKSTAETQYVKYVNLLLSCLRNCKVSAVCELTENYDIHFHAIAAVELATVVHPMKYLKDIFRNDFGYTVIKQVDDFEGWINYLNKDVKRTNDLLKTVQNPVPAILKDDYDVLREVVDMNEYEPDITG